MGPGGGGADYPDDYVLNLRGKILHFDFDGPYVFKDNHPSEATKKLEPQLLATFQTF